MLKRIISAWMAILVVMGITSSFTPAASAVDPLDYWVNRIPSYKVSIRRKRMLGNKIVVIILAMLMMLGGIPGLQVPGEGNVYAAPGDTYSGEGAGTVEDPYQIATAEQLNEVRNHMDKDSHFVLTKDIDLSGFASDPLNPSLGWEPIGGLGGAAFQGGMDGNGYKIRNLTINSRKPYAGLFGFISDPAVVTNMKLENVNVVSNDDFVGGLVGYTSGGTISNSYVTGDVKDNGIGDFGDHVGGLVGYKVGGTISNSYATAAVVVSSGAAGGLVGSNDSGTISNSYAMGKVTSGGSDAGGLVGYNEDGTISYSYATGNVTGGGSDAGGLVGTNGGTISNSYATGNVTGIGGDGVVGGLVGFNDGGTISNSHSKGDVTGNGTEVGGLVGENGSGAINNSYATGNVTGTGGDGVVGGLVGFNGSGAISNSYATGNVTGTGGDGTVGGLVGSNGSGAISYSYATGNVTGSSDYVGGLVGANKIGTISYSYARGDVKETGSGDYVGGLVGYNVYGTISYSYATGIVTGSGGNVGGLVGKNENEGTISNSFYDKDKTGQSDTGKGEGKSTTEMMTSSTYNYWEDFANIWAIDTSLTVNDGYPYLDLEKVVTYEGNGNTGGTVPDAVYQNYNTTVTVAGNIGSLTRTGYTFAGWKTAADGNKATYQAGQTFTLGGDVTLYAHWDANSYTVSFKSIGGGTVDDVQADYGTKIAEPDTPVREGYTFAGWYKDTEFKNEWNFDVDTVPVDGTTLYAKWTINPYTVTYDGNGGEGAVPGTVTQNYNTAVTVADNTGGLTRTGYTFAGWKTAADGNEVTYPAGQTFTLGGDDVTLYAHWDANSYTVRFMSNGGTVGDVQADYGTKIAAPDTPVREGYTLAGWYKETEFTNEWNFDADTVPVDGETLYAKWTINTYTVSFNSNRGTTVDSQTVSYNNKVSQPASPTRSGYTFGGWYSDSDLAVPFDFNTLITANATLYAKWTANSTGNSSGNGSPSTPSGDSVTSTDGTLTLPKGKTGGVSLSDAIKIDIPANATDKELKLTIEKVLSTQNLLTNNEVLASPVFEILKNFLENFRMPVTITIKFDPNSIKANQKPAVFYYDEVKKEWVNIGGIVNGNKITVEVNHFTKHAVFAVSQADTPTTENPADQATDVIFSDIAGHWAEASIKQAVSNGIVKGYTDGTFKPNQIVSRAEFAVMLMNALKPQGAGAELTFTDTAKIGAWAKEAVAQAVKAGMISGYEDGSFRPDAKITRAEMAKMIANALKLSVESDATTDFADDMDIPTWAKGAVAAMRSLEIVAGTGNNQFNPDAPATRVEAVTVLLKMLAHQSK